MCSCGKSNELPSNARSSWLGEIELLRSWCDNSKQAGKAVRSPEHVALAPACVAQGKDTVEGGLCHR
jgi:hypothetical protein